MSDPSIAPDLTEKRNEVITKLVESYTDRLHDLDNHELLEFLGRNCQVDLYKELDDVMNEHYK